MGPRLWAQAPARPNLSAVGDAATIGIFVAIIAAVLAAVIVPVVWFVVMVAGEEGETD